MNLTINKNLFVHNEENFVIITVKTTGANYENRGTITLKNSTSTLFIKDFMNSNFYTNTRMRNYTNERILLQQEGKSIIKYENGYFISSEGTYKLFIPISSLQSGFYEVSVENLGKRKIERFIIEK
ncbi:MAG: hypothetical protein AABX04_04845 [Nanoarchaeota archaeon]